MFIKSFKEYISLFIHTCGFNSIVKFLGIIIISFISYSITLGQDCIQYPEIDGPECIICWPSGWSPINSPDMVDPLGSTGRTDGLSGPSPSGNNVAYFATTGSHYGEGLSTTINNLTPGQCYTFGIWWEETTARNVWLVPGLLSITIQGEEFIFSDAPTWQLAQATFTAASTSVEIIVAVVIDGVPHSIVVDGPPDCSVLVPSPCCPLLVTADDAYEACPGDAITLNANVQNPTGNVQVEWTSIPANGVNFLNDVNILNPIFTFPTGDFDGETFNFLLTVTDDLCTKTKEVEVTVLKSEVPTFDFNICELSDRNAFPLTSINGYKGTWNGNFNFSEIAGSTQNYTFVLAAQEVNCIREVNVEVEILKADSLSFDFEKLYCDSDSNIYSLPLLSLEFVQGNWDVSRFQPSALRKGLFSFLFKPDKQFCALPYQDSISVRTNPIFDNILCSPNNLIVLDSLSKNGIKGYWSPQIINQDTLLNKEFISVWTVIDTMLSCKQNVEMTFKIQEPIKLNFDLVDSLCINSGIYTLPTFSLDSISGQWNIGNINTDVSEPGIIALIFIPSQTCVEDFNFKIEIKEKREPIFDIKTDLCQASDIINLPSTSLDGISGSWTHPIIDPSIINDGFISTFIPNNSFQSCYLPINLKFQVSTSITPTFDIPTSVCSKEAPLIFPIISKNGILGSWTIDTIDFSLIDSNFVVNTFKPLNPGCEDSLQLTIEIVKIEWPVVTFNHPTDCNNTDGSIILTGSITEKEFSLNGILWDSKTIFDSLSSGQYYIYQRSILNNSCVDSLLIDLKSPSLPKIIKMDVSDITSCKVNNGKINCTAEGENLEYSIDGLRWQNLPLFVNLAPNNYTVYIRNASKINCKDQADVVINALQNILFVDLKISPVSDCGQVDGKISISAIGENLEYSINGGVSYNSTPDFINLTANQYNIVVRSAIYTDCIIDTLVNLEAPSYPNELVISKTDVSTCGKDDGSIRISAKGKELEYSINGGLSWSIDSIFNGLSAKEYEIVVREKNQENCKLNESIILNATDAPKLLNQTIIQPSKCTSNDGIITLELNASDIEYSIDQGNNWQSSGKFSNLGEGNYSILFRPINAPFCKGEVSVDIVNPPCPCNKLDIDFNVTKVNCKNKLSGEISIKTITGFLIPDNISFLWENGTTGYTLSNLAQGWYSYTLDYDKNCTLKDSIFVSTFDPIQFVLKGFDVSCDSLGRVEVFDLNGGSGQYLYSNDGIIYQQSSTFFNLTANEYEIIVKDIYGCDNDDKIIIGTENNLNLELPTIKPIRKGTSIVLNPLINQSTIDSFTWTPNKYILNPGELIAEVAPPVTTEYLLTIYFGNCSETRSVIIEVLEAEDLFMPNIISLNSTNNNNKFYFFGSSDNNIKIDYYKFFDRWGNLVYQKDNPEINNPEHGWDGTMSGRNIEQGVYLYMSEVTINGQKKVISGSITVIR